jgi:glycosyltransferase involved in cell wall biosynthesis
LQGLPLQVGLFQDRAQSAAIRAAADRFDLLYVYYIRSAESTRGIRSPPRVLAMQLSQTLNIERMLAHFRTRRERWLYRLELPRVRAYEARAWQRFTQTVLIGPADLEAVERTCATARQPRIDNAVLIPHGVDISQAPSDPALQEPETVIFLGVLATNTNVEAVLWFCREVWPLVRRDRPNARFLVLGRRPRAAVLALDGADGVEVVGEVDDPSPYLARAAVAVNPVKAGAGMQNKLLDYAAAGKAIVATSIANEGIGLPPGAAALIADTPADFAAAVLHLMDDRAESLRLGHNARNFVEAGWSWEAWFLRLEATLYETAGIEP